MFHHIFVKNGDADIILGRTAESRQKEIEVASLIMNDIFLKLPIILILLGSISQSVIPRISSLVRLTATFPYTSMERIKDLTSGPYWVVTLE